MSEKMLSLLLLTSEDVPVVAVVSVVVLKLLEFFRLVVTLESRVSVDMDIILGALLGGLLFHIFSFLPHIFSFIFGF